MELLHVSGSVSAYHQEFSTVHSALAFVIQVRRHLACRAIMELQFHAGPSWSYTLAVARPVQHVPVPNVQWKTDDGQRNCPKHLEFRTRIKLEISASVGFVVKKFVTMHGHMNVKSTPVVNNLFTVTYFRCKCDHYQGRVRHGQRFYNA
jgi:hypothetical protein